MSPDRHLVLVGIMGSGKTVAGRNLADRLDRELIDTDAAIEAEAERTIAEIFADDGEGGFRLLERGVVQRSLRRSEPAVIATGGGAILDHESRRLMAERGIVVWLDPPIGPVAERLREDEGRPLLDGAPVAERLAELRADRADLYGAAAHVRIETDGDIDSVADAVLVAVDGIVAA